MRLCDYSPAWRLFADPSRGYGVLAAFDLSLTAAFRLSGCDHTCMSVSDLASVSRDLGQFLSALPASVLVRVYSLSLLPYAREVDTYVARFTEGSFAHHLAQEKARQLRENLAPRKRELLLTVTTPPKTSGLDWNSASSFRLLMQGYFNPRVLRRNSDALTERAAAVVGEQVRQLRQLTDITVGHLNSAGVGAHVLEPNEFFGLAWRLANPMRAMMYEPPSLRRGVSLRSQLFASGMQAEKDFIRREGHVQRVVSLQSLPEAVFPGHVSKLQNLSFPHVLCVSVRRRDVQETTKALERIRDRGFELRSFRGCIKGRAKSDENPDFVVRNQQQSANAMLELVHSGDSPCDLAMQMLVCAPNEESLDSCTEDAISAFRKFNKAEGAIDEYRSRQAFLSLLPGHHLLTGDRFHPVLASRAADFLPIFAPYHGAPNPTYMLTTGERTLYGFHPFNSHLSSHNMVVSGSTGKGKSATVRALLAGHVARGGRAVIITKGSDYHRFAELFGGEAFDISLEDKDLALGPFTSAEVMQLETSNGRSRLAHLSAAIAVLATGTGEKLTRVQQRLLYSSLRECYRRVSRDVAPTFRDMMACLETERDKGSAFDGESAESLIGNLRFWVDGPYGEIFCRNRPAFESKVTVWNLEHLPGQDEKNVVLALLSRIVGSSVRAGPTVVVVDEGWDLFSTDAGAYLTVNWFRTIRKEGSAIWAISQTIDDFLTLRDDVRKATVNNAELRILAMHKSDEEIQKAASVFGLNETQVARLRALKSEQGRYSDLMIFAGSRCQVVQLVMNGSELWMATSDKKDVRLEDEVRSRFPRHKRAAIVQALGRRYPHGAAHA